MINQLEQFSLDVQSRVHDVLLRYLPAKSDCPRLLEAMNYSCLNGGKRVRAMLIYASSQLCGVDDGVQDLLAASLEIMHAFSLVHDDLPAMDDDELRRGKPTCHVAFDEAIAILAGDALHNLSFEILSAEDSLPLDAAVRLSLVRILADSVGARGMVAGQALDVTSEGVQLTLAEQEKLHALKTGRLIEASVLMPLIASPFAQDATYYHALSSYAKHIGILFQIQDDILDVTSDSVTLGKTAGKDQQQVKSTYPGILGLDQAKALAKRHYQQAIAALSEITDHSLLHELAWYILNRES